MGIFDKFKAKFSKARCACCGRKVVPFTAPRKSTVDGKLADLLSRKENLIDLTTQLPKMQAHHGVVCERCGAVVCTVCFVSPGYYLTRGTFDSFCCRECNWISIPKVYRG